MNSDRKTYTIYGNFDERTVFALRFFLRLLQKLAEIEMPPAFTSKNAQAANKKQGGKETMLSRPALRSIQRK